MAHQDVLHKHQPHGYVPRHATERLKQETAQSFNDRLSVQITKATGTMWCAYVFTFIGVGSLVALFTGNLTLGLIFGGISSYFLQLVMLPVIQNGTAVLSRHQELMAEEQFHTTQRSFHEIEQIVQHLNAQDKELLKQTHMLVKLAGGDENE